MKRFLKVLCAAWLTGAVMGGGCFCGAVGAGLLVQRGSAERSAMYDHFAANPIDEMAGVE